MVLSLALLIVARRFSIYARQTSLVIAQDILISVEHENMLNQYDRTLSIMLRLRMHDSARRVARHITQFPAIDCCAPFTSTFLATQYLEAWVHVLFSCPTDEDGRKPAPLITLLRY